MRFVSLVILTLALPACGRASIPTSSNVATSMSVPAVHYGKIRFSPSTLTFASWTSPPKDVKIAQRHYRGSFGFFSGGACLPAFNATFVRYTKSHASIWSVYPTAQPIGTDPCAVTFTGGGGAEANLPIVVK